MKIEINNRQREQPVSPKALRTLIRRLIPRIRELNPGLDWAWLSLTLVDDAGMIPVHAAHFGDHRTTDVVSCAYAPQPGVTEGWIGEVYVNVQRAMEEGDQRPGGPAAELALYVAHGLDHLSGATDDTEARRRTMLRREEAWIRDFPVNGLMGPAKD